MFERKFVIIRAIRGPNSKNRLDPDALDSAEAVKQQFPLFVVLVADHGAKLFHASSKPGLDGSQRTFQAISDLPLSQPFKINHFDHFALLGG